MVLVDVRDNNRRPAASKSDKTGTLCSSVIFLRRYTIMPPKVIFHKVL